MSTELKPVKNSGEHFLFARRGNVSTSLISSFQAPTFSSAWPRLPFCSLAPSTPRSRPRSPGGSPSPATSRQPSRPSKTQPVWKGRGSWPGRTVRRRSRPSRRSRTAPTSGRLRTGRTKSSPGRSRRITRRKEKI